MKKQPSLVDTKFFRVIAPYIKIQGYTREGGTKNPRNRIEVVSSIPAKIKDRALQFIMPCVNCKSPMNPFRARQSTIKRGPEAGTDPPYFAACCPLDVNKGCSRTKNASNEYELVAAAVREFQRT